MSDQKHGANFLSGIDPENLLVVDTPDIQPLLEHHYRALSSHTDALRTLAVDWLAARGEAGNAVIASEADFAGASDLYAKLRDYAGGDGLLEGTRKRAKAKPASAVSAIDGWFNGLRGELLAAMKEIDGAQNRFASARSAREQAAREDAAYQLRLEAATAAAAARRTDATDAAVDAAISLEEAAQVAAIDAAKPVVDHTRNRSVGGVTTSVSGKWMFRVTDITELCQAVDRQSVPPDFVTTNDAVINAAIRGKNGRRDVPGLEIYQETKINRRGG